MSWHLQSNRGSSRIDFELLTSAFLVEKPFSQWLKEFALQVHRYCVRHLREICASLEISTEGLEASNHLFKVAPTI